MWHGDACQSMKTQITVPSTEQIEALISGVGSLLSGGRLVGTGERRTDADAIRSDFVKVGNDIRKATKRIDADLAVATGSRKG